MKVPFLSTKKTTARTPRREDALVVGLVAILLFLLVVLAWDGFLYDRIRVRRLLFAAPPESSAVLTSQELDDVLGLLDARARQYEELAGSIP